VTVLRLLAFLSLTLLPGAWVTFSRWGQNLSTRARLFVGLMLSPLVVILQFYMARGLGFSFSTTTVLLVLMNLPAALLIARTRVRWCLPDWRGLAIVASFYAVPLGLLAVRLHDPGLQLFYGHGWMHADIMYRIAQGDLLPEDPALAGLQLAYPWGGHVYQALLSYVLGSTPLLSYAWTNVLWLIGCFGIVGAIVACLGGGRFAQASAAVWLAFGVNPVGFSLGVLLPSALTERYPIFGNWRYAPWMRKFYGLDQMAFALGMYCALVLVSVAPGHGRLSRGSQLIAGLLIVSIGVVYPLLFPAAAAVLIARVAANVLWAGPDGRRQSSSESVGLLCALGVSTLTTLLHLQLVTRDRITPTGISVHSFHDMELQAASAVLVLSVLGLGVAAAFTRQYRENRQSLTVLLLAAAGSVFLYVIFLVPNVRNEYKYMMTAAVCLAPFPGIALEPLLGRRRRTAMLAVVLLVVAVVAPAAWRMADNWPDVTGVRMNVEARGFDIRLSDADPLAAAADAIRETTDPRTMVVAVDTLHHLPTVTQRVLYAPYRDGQFAGVGLGTDFTLAAVKGYGAEILRERRDVLDRVYSPGSDDARPAAWAILAGFRRPIAVVIDDSRHAGLREWLAARREGTLIVSSGGVTVWYAVDPLGDGGRSTP
jgi:hypothetical protein